jgi:hypothetical protein
MTTQEKIKATELKFGQVIQYKDIANPNLKFKVLGATSKWLYARNIEMDIIEQIELNTTFVANESLHDGFNRWFLA